MTYWESCKKLKFDHTNKWYIHKPECPREWSKILWDFEILTDHLILARRPDLVLINKKKRICLLMDFAILADHRMKIEETEKIDKYLNHSKEFKKLWNMKVTVISIVVGFTSENDWKNWKSDHSIVKIS